MPTLPTSSPRPNSRLPSKPVGPKASPAVAPAPGSNDRLLPIYILAGLIVLIGTPVAIGLGASWIDWSDAPAASSEAPKWVGSETVRATSSDGEVVKARVAIDADAASTRSVLESNRRDVALLMQISIASQDRKAMRGAEGMTRLSDDMRDRLNTFLAGHQVPGVKQVIVQDLLINKP